MNPTILSSIFFYVSSLHWPQGKDQIRSSQIYVVRCLERAYLPASWQIKTASKCVE